VPVVFLYDGSAAVCLFFIMSGVALTQAFSVHPFAISHNVLRRLIRLGLPMIAGVLLGAALFSWLPDAHVAAAAQTRSHWLRDLGPREISATAIVHQILFEGLLAGFDGWTLWPSWLVRVTKLGLVDCRQAFDTPLWTLHLEFYGSILVLGLVAVRAVVSPSAHRAVCIILGCAFILSPLGLFVLGHAVADYVHRDDGRGARVRLGAACLISGILLCTLPIFSFVSNLWKLLPAPPLGLQGDPITLQIMIGVAFIFGGVALMPNLQRRLASPVLRWLGKISFSLYLLHLPFELTCVAACFTLLDSLLPYNAAVAVVSVAGIGASFALAALFERWIDRPSIKLSRMIGLPRERTVAAVSIAETA